MGLVARQVLSEGLRHEYWAWRQHKSVGARIDSWEPSTRHPACSTCYDRKDTPPDEAAPSPTNPVADKDAAQSDANVMKAMSHLLPTLLP